MAFAEITMRSTVLRMDVKVSVIIPESRKDYREDDPNKKYKVLYVLHGGSEDNSTWLNSSILYLLARDLDLFVFMPSAYNSSYVNTDFGLKMQQYISEELPAKMARLFPISTAREDTFIMGESMGGYGTWLTTLLHPEKYGKACPLSGTGNRGDGPALPMSAGAGSLFDLAKQKNDSGEKLTEYLFMCGTEDPGYERNLVFMDYLKQNCPNISVKEEYWTGKHDFFFWNQAIPKALQFFGFEFDPDKIKQI